MILPVIQLPASSIYRCFLGDVTWPKSILSKGDASMPEKSPRHPRLSPIFISLLFS
jgi:hypothetical protein